MRYTNCRPECTTTTTGSDAKLFIYRVAYAPPPKVSWLRRWWRSTRLYETIQALRGK